MIYPAHDPGVYMIQPTTRPHNEKLNKHNLQTVPSKFRLVIEASRYGNGIDGRIKRGNDVVHGWGTSGVPTDLSRFLATQYYYESTSRYFEMFLKLTNGAYPIVFQDSEGHETPLVYCSDESRRAGITFDIRGEEIHISRSLDNGSPIPAGALLHGQLLFNPEAGVIHAISNRSAWKIWEEVIEDLDAVNDFNEFGRFESEDDDYEDYDDFDEEDKDRDEPAVTSPELRRLPHAVVTSISVFNSASIRLSPEMINDADGNCYFLRAGLDMGTPSIGTPSYLLDIPHGMTALKVLLTPVGLYDNQTFAFSNAAFWLLNPYRRLNLSAPMKTKKRVRAILETAFALLEVTKATARNAIIRSLTNSPDFLKRVVKREAKQLLSHLSEEWSRNMSLLMVGSDGWHCVEDDRLSQARLVRILFEMFGVDAFGEDLPPGGLEVPSAQLLKELPRLVARLQQEGFLLRIGSEPLAEASWEFILDATRSGMDWFELKPEIRCNGVILSDEEMNGLFNGAGDLVGTGWVLEELAGTTFVDTVPTITFGGDGTVTGSAGCNTFSGTYAVDGTSLDFGPLATTKMACADPTMFVESAFLAALRGVTGWSVRPDGRLVLEGRHPLTFGPA